MKNVKNNEGFLNIVIGVLVVALLLGALGYVVVKQRSLAPGVPQGNVSQNPPAPAPQAAPPPAPATKPAPTPAPSGSHPAQVIITPATPTVVWQKYENSTYGYSLKYPVDAPIVVSKSEAGFMMRNPGGEEVITMHVVPLPLTSVITYSKQSEVDNTYNISALNNLVGGIICENDAQTLNGSCYSSPDTKYNLSSLKARLLGAADAPAHIDFRTMAGKKALVFGKLDTKEDASLYLVDLGNATLMIFFTAPAAGDASYLADYFPETIDSISFVK